LLGAARRGLLAQLGAVLLFSPFLSPLFYEAGVPSVVVVTALQFRYYPQFFDRNERRHRQRSFRAACRCASRLVCISDYVMATVIELGRVAPDRCVRIYLGARGRLVARPDAAVYQRWALTPGEYLLYPANFWPHKNHERLLAAFARYVQRVPRSRLKLMCCGAPGPHEHRVRQAAQSAGLDGRAVFPGYVSDRELEALLAGAKALIFPSLYEGFGMPLLEAMEAGCPVLASATASLPEIGGQAYFAFDPLCVEAIGDAIARIDSDPALAAALVERGKEQAALFGDAERMAHEYLAVFRHTLGVAPAVSESGLALRQIRL
jgi:glycosyltransferase involved in cell wall biosynthesis